MNSKTPKTRRSLSGQVPKNLFLHRLNLQTLKFNLSGDRNYGEGSSVGSGQLPLVSHSNQTQLRLVNSYNSTLVIQAMLTLLCENRGQDQRGKNDLFKYLYHQLIELGAVTPVSAVDHQLASIRKQYYKAFKMLIASYKSTSSVNAHRYVPDFLFSTSASSLTNAVSLYHNGMSPDWQMKDILSSSRYEDEFDEISQLGSGGFGVVYKVRNKLDNVVYAIKKIRQQSHHQKNFVKVKDEVRHLATLRHPNIVTYYSAWWEHDFTTAAHIEEGDVESSRVIITEVEMGSQTSDEVMVSESSAKLSKLTVQPQTPHMGKFWIGKSNETDESETSQASKSHNKLQDPNSFTIILYIQMELCHTNLEEYLKRRNQKIDSQIDPMSFIDGQASEALMHQIISGVEFIHSKQLIHRDLKPSNIFLDESVTIVKIGDFGLARSISRKGGCHSPNGSPPLTPFDHYASPSHKFFTAKIGTGTYAAPEQLKSSNYDQKADIYSLGIIYFELFYPFGTGMERVKALENLRQLHGNIPEMNTIATRYTYVANTIVKLLKEDPKQRPRAMEILASRPEKSLEEVNQDLKEQLKLKDQHIKTLSDRVSAQQVYIRGLQRRLRRLKTRLLSSPTTQTASKKY